MTSPVSSSSRRLVRRASFSDITEATPLLRTAPSPHVAAGDSTDPRRERMWELMSSYLGSDVHTIQRAIVNHVEYTLASTRFNFDDNKAYRATAHSVRDRLIESWNDTNEFFHDRDVKRVTYMSLEFLIGRYMQNALLNTDLENNYTEALREMGYNLEKLYTQEPDPALGNGGLGRLAACFLDSMATLDLPAWGYGIRYNYGIFRQKILDGYQVEVPDYWLTMGNPWEIERVDVAYLVRFGGVVSTITDEGGTERGTWAGGERVLAVAYDNPVPGYDTFNTINLRLWKSTPAKEFDFASFNSGDYLKAVEERHRAESISSVLYPSDSTHSGKELRLKQQYFFVCATLQDIVRRFKKRKGWKWSEFPQKNAVQLNDTHPSIAIAELMRLLIDTEEGLSWDEAWVITTATFGYTNHTILPEALEKWSVELFEQLLPRHLQIIYKINWHFLQEVERRWPGDTEKQRKLSIVEESPRMIRMAHLAIIGAHCVNGVAAIHSELLKTAVFPEFYELYRDRFTNITNGVTPRRWMNQANRPLSKLISAWLDGSEWIKKLELLTGLRGFVENDTFQAEWADVKKQNKLRLAAYVKKELGIELNVDALFDVQVKRMHEYKRQLMNVLYIIHRYQSIKRASPADRARFVPRVCFFGGKAAPGYITAKRVIKLIHDVAAVVNTDPDCAGVLTVIFIPNYNVSNAEIIIPASDLSQHISTAGMEASGTSNMKFAMNGGLIIGTMDGANIEIASEIGRDNIFIFGAETPEIAGLRHDRQFKAPVPPCRELAAVFAAMVAGEFGKADNVQPLLDGLSWRNDYYLLTHDFPSYLDAQRRVDACYAKKDEWVRKSILSVAGMGMFSTDRTITEYAQRVWNAVPCRRPNPQEGLESTIPRARSFPRLAGADLSSHAR